MKQIYYKNEVVAILHQQSEWKEGLDFLTPNETYIQAGTWNYNKGKSLNAHRHLIYERVVKQTQETIIVMSGSIRIDLYDENNSIFHKQVLCSGDIFVILDIGHGYEILDDKTKIVEIKNGPFVSVEKDKQLI